MSFAHDISMRIGLQAFVNKLANKWKMQGRGSLSHGVNSHLRDVHEVVVNKILLHLKGNLDSLHDAAAVM